MSAAEPAAVAVPLRVSSPPASRPEPSKPKAARASKPALASSMPYTKSESNNDLRERLLNQLYDDE